MRATTTRPSLAPAALAAVAYPTTGVGFGTLASSVPPGTMRTVWRLAAFLASGVIFLLHLRWEHVHRGPAHLRAASQAALSVAVGAFLLAAAGPVRSYGIASRQGVLSLVLWPLITGAPALLAAWLLVTLVSRRSGPASPPRAGVI